MNESGKKYPCDAKNCAECEYGQADGNVRVVCALYGFTCIDKTVKNCDRGTI